MEEIERGELIELLKKISENDLARGLELDIDNYSIGIAYVLPKRIKIDVKWLINQILDKLENPATSEPKNYGLAICTHYFISCANEDTVKRKLIHSTIVSQGEEFTIQGHINGNICLKSKKTKLIYDLPSDFYHNHFKEYRN